MLFLVGVFASLCLFCAFLVLFLVNVFASLCYFLVLFLVNVFAFAGAKFAEKSTTLVLLPYKFHALSLILSSGAMLDPIVPFSDVMVDPIVFFFAFLVLFLVGMFASLCFLLFWCYFL